MPRSRPSRESATACFEGTLSRSLLQRLKGLAIRTQSVMRSAQEVSMMRTELSEKSKGSKVTLEESSSVTQVDDRVYAKPHGQVAAFRFDDRVARCFDDMIRRSVPGYDLSLQSIATLTRRYFQPGSTVVDLGASLGASTLPWSRGFQGVRDACWPSITLNRWSSVCASI